MSELSICSLTTESFLSLAICLATPTLLGRLASCHVRLFKQVYHTFTIKPRGIPANSLFKPIWTCLYLSMGLASFLVYQTGKQNTNLNVFTALAYYSTQLLFNLCWPAVFFRYRNYKVSLYIITLTLFTAIVTTYKFYYINTTAAILMVPYLVWLTIGGYINKKIWRLNANNEKLRAVNKSNYNKFLSNNKLDVPTNNLCQNCNQIKEE